MRQGITQGMQKNQEDIVLNMLSQRLEMQTISKYTKLDISEIEGLKIKFNKRASSMKYFSLILLTFIQ